MREVKSASSHFFLYDLSIYILKTIQDTYLLRFQMQN